MRPLVANGQVWPVILVAPDDARLIDRTGGLRLATTDPATRTVHMSSALRPPLLDAVMLHEAAHVMTMAYGLLGPLRNALPEDSWVLVEEWSAQLLEKHGIEAAIAASMSLGRPVCIASQCVSAE